MPWWAALLIATTATVIGYSVDASHKELTHAFAGCYIAGCVIAVLAVRQAAVFTAVIQPPLILFGAVPCAYWLFHGAKTKNLKDLLINCGYPLIERFPLMLGTAGAVLLIGLIRWYLGMKPHPAAANADNDIDATESTSVISGLTAKLASMLRGSDDEYEGADAGSPGAHAVGRARRPRPQSSRAARGTRYADRSARNRSRHSRTSSLEDRHGSRVERPRRQSRTSNPDIRDFDAVDPPRRSRPDKPQRDPDLRRQPPREARRDRDPHARPQERRNPYERPASRGSRVDPYETREPARDREREPSSNRYEKPNDRYEPYERPRRRATPAGPNGANPTHHPISQVRYRGTAPADESRDNRRDDPRAERRSRPSPPGRSESREADSWEYDI